LFGDIYADNDLKIKYVFFFLVLVTAVGLIASAWSQQDSNRSLCETRESHWSLGDQKYLYSVLAKDLADQVF